MKREARNRQAVLMTAAEPELTDLGSGECAHEAAGTQDKVLHSRAEVSVDDMQKDQELQGFQRRVLALRTELKEVKDQLFALQKKLHLQAVPDKSEHTETIPEGACDSGHLEAVSTWQRERTARRRCESSNARRD